MAFAKRILVATDFSEPARAAYAPARQLAADMGAKLLVVHVHDRSVPRASDQGRRLASIPEADAKLETRLAELVDRDLPGAEASVIDDDDVPAAICRHAEEQAADLIVIATQGVTGIVRLLLGSVAEAVVRQAHCPVLTVRGEAGE